MERSLQKTENLLTSSSIATVDGLVSYRKTRPHYGSVPREARLKWMAKEISILSAMQHQNTDAGMITFDAVTLDDMMSEDPAIMDLTQLEIMEAFRKGLRGVYGEFYGLTASSLYHFLSGYMKSEKKIAATRKILGEQKKPFNDAPAEKIAEYKRIASEREKNGEPVFQPPMFKTADEITEEERNAHRAKIELQAQEIYRKYRQTNKIK